MRIGTYSPGQQMTYTTQLERGEGSKTKEAEAKENVHRKGRSGESRSAKAADAGVIKPVQYPEWLANVVMVRKKNKKWQMCVDFIDLNKCCPKDLCPLPRIDKLVDIAARCKVMSLLDCFLGYHQIWLNPDDEEKTSFITLGGTYCY